ncbi:NAD(P)-dependent oxidoreductase [Salinicola aestuarinus]|uniref:NAD(P)-dependent oxidoreductase n=1 Tax=Salinicola aestuarinus TaxID=1949082 RepID=UPI000DA231A1|nr:NAD(P)-dependent oxidoreductase [Salinicola aestuarinus]
MPTTVALLAPGAMGAAIARRLTDHGVEVITSLVGRSDASVTRARDAGMRDVDLDELMRASLLLSVVPPAEAEALAVSLAPHLASAPTPPVYCDLNAVSTATLSRIEHVIRGAGAEFVDGGIIGPPPSAEKTPRIYVAGEHSDLMTALNDAGLDVRALAGGCGSASALKLCFAGINKGMTALTTMMLIAAARSGAGSALRDELTERLPEVVTRIDEGIPDMLPKAWRWHPEMREIADFLDDSDPLNHNPAGRSTFEGFAALYEQLGDADDELERLIAPLMTQTGPQDR